MTKATTTSTLANAADTDNVELKPVAGSKPLPNSEDMFLSPRVMDAGTFARYAEMLKGIIAQATAQGRTLEDFSADAEEMIRRATESGTTLDKRLQAGVRLMKLIDERVDRTEAALDQIQENLPSAESVQRRLEEHANAAIDGATARLESIANRAEERARAAHEHAERAAARLEALNAQIEQRAEQLDTLTRECSALAQHRTDELNRSADSATLAINTCAEEAVTSINARADEAVTSVSDRTKETLTDLETRAESTLSRIETRLNAVTEQSTTLQQTASAQIEELRAIIAPVREGAERAVSALGMDPNNPKLEDSVLGRIESLVERGETHIAATERLFRQIDELRNQAEAAKADFGAWLLDAADKIDILEERKDTLEGPISTAAANIQSFTPELESRIETAMRTIEHLSTQSKALRESIHIATALADKAKSDLTNQSSQMQALLDGALHKLTQRVEEAGTWLGSLITQAQSLKSAGQVGTSPDLVRAPSTEALDTLNDRSDALLRDLDQIQSSLESLRQDGDSTPIAFTIDAPTTESVNTTEPITEPKPETTRASVLPQRLHIDSLSFDGATKVIEHTPRDNDSTPESAD